MSRPDTHGDVNIGSWLAHHAATRPDHVALIAHEPRARLSYGQLEARTNAVAAALAGFGVGPGERIALALNNEPLCLEVYFAAALLGAVFVPLNTRLSAPELRFQIEDCRPALVVRAADVELGDLPDTHLLERAQLLDAVPQRAAPPGPVPGGERPQVILYTSGTTGSPKGAVLPHRKTLYNTLNAERYFGLCNADVVVAPIPLFHSFGLKILSVPALFAGATLVLIDRFDPIGLQQAVASYGGTLLGAVPLMYERMLAAGLLPEALSSLRYAFSAGAPLGVETIHAYYEQGVRIQQGYGQTETSILCCLAAEDAIERAGSVGKPVRHVELRIADELGRALPPGEPGEIQARGPVVMSGYWEQPEETAGARCDGWHRTGDLGVMDRAGFVTLVGRRKELYISGGENVYPAEVERVLEAHPGVAEAAVAGVPDPRWGEAGRAFCVARSAAVAAEELLAWAGQQLARYKLPRDVIWVDELPRTASGKVRKHVLLELHHDS